MTREHYKYYKYTGYAPPLLTERVSVCMYVCSKRESERGREGDHATFYFILFCLHNNLRTYLIIIIIIIIGFLLQNKVSYSSFGDTSNKFSVW